MVIRYRRAELGDAEGIAQTWAESWRTTYTGMVPDAVIARISVEERLQKIHKRLETSMPQLCCFVAEEVTNSDTARIVGFATGGPNREPDGVHTGELEAIYLLRSHHRQGIGQKLVALVANHLEVQGMTTMLTWCLAANPSHGFYERLGGSYVRDGVYSPIGIDIPEVAYGWTDLASLIALAPPMVENTPTSGVAHTEIDVTTKPVRSVVK